MRLQQAKSTGIRRFGGSAGDGVDLPPTATCIMPTSGSSVEFDLDPNGRNRHLIVMQDMVFSNAATLILELRRLSDGIYETGPTAYRWANQYRITWNVPQNRANWIISNTDAIQPIHAAIFITDVAANMPSEFISWQWLETGATGAPGFAQGAMNTTDAHDKLKISVDVGTFTTGTICHGVME